MSGNPTIIETIRRFARKLVGVDVSHSGWRPMTPEENEQFDATFEAFDRVFVEMDKLFDTIQSGKAKP